MSLITIFIFSIRINKHREAEAQFWNGENDVYYYGFLIAKAFAFSWWDWSEKHVNNPRLKNFLKNIPCILIFRIKTLSYNWNNKGRNWRKCTQWKAAAALLLMMIWDVSSTSSTFYRKTFDLANRWEDWRWFSPFWICSKQKHPQIASGANPR